MAFMVTGVVCLTRERKRTNLSIGIHAITTELLTIAPDIVERFDSQTIVHMGSNFDCQGLASSERRAQLMEFASKMSDATRDTVLRICDTQTTIDSHVTMQDGLMDQMYALEQGTDRTEIEDLVRLHTTLLGSHYKILEALMTLFEAHVYVKVVDDEMAAHKRRAEAVEQTRTRRRHDEPKA